MRTRSGYYATPDAKTAKVDAAHAVGDDARLPAAPVAEPVSALADRDLLGLCTPTRSGSREFWRFAWKERRELWRYLRWAERMAWSARERE